jgi:hypothetical protein
LILGDTRDETLDLSHAVELVSPRCSFWENVASAASLSSAKILNATGRFDAKLMVLRLSRRPFNDLAPGLTEGGVKDGLLVLLKGDCVEGVQVPLLRTPGVILDESGGETLLCGEAAVCKTGLLEVKEDLRLLCDSVSYAGGRVSCDGVRCKLPIGGLVDS